MKRTHWLPLLTLILAPACVAEWHDGNDDEWEWEDESDCGACDVPDPATPDECPDPERALFLDTDGHGCSGIEFTCSDGYVPFRADCGCGCVLPPEPPPVCDEAAQQHFYVSRERDACNSITFVCPSGQDRYDSECGCGCWTPPGPVCPDETDSRVHYLGDDPSVCALISFTCPEACTTFNDECGCGCIEP